MPSIQRALGFPTFLCRAFLLLLLAGLAPAQDFQTPGMPRSTYGQTDRFNNEQNPAIGLIADTHALWVDSDDEDADGLELDLRSLELGLAAWIDPTAQAFGTVVAEDEELAVEEAWVQYLGLGDRTGLRAGRFFVDFGKQMQGHVHELPYPERPLVLRTYLGDELGGDGLQLDHWEATGDESAIRFSLAAFQSLLGEGEGEVPEALGDERADFGDLSFTGRVTQFMDAGSSGVFQWGASVRHIGDYTLVDEADGLAERGLSNTVAGVDLTYGTTDASGLSGWSAGLEWLLASGDLSGEVVDGGGGPSLELFDEDVSGYYLWLDRRLDPKRSLGLLWSEVEVPVTGSPSDSELTLYHSVQLSEFLRLRFALGYLDPEDGDEELGAIVQLTGVVGPHGHGVSW